MDADTRYARLLAVEHDEGVGGASGRCEMIQRLGELGEERGAQLLGAGRIEWATKDCGAVGVLDGDLFAGVVV